MPKPINATQGEANRWRRNLAANASQPTPQATLDAMQVIAADLRARGYVGCYVADTGGGSFYHEWPMTTWERALRADLLVLAQAAGEAMARSERKHDRQYHAGGLAYLRQVMDLLTGKEAPDA
jgi:hypothetical protein